MNKLYPCLLRMFLDNAKRMVALSQLEYGKGRVSPLYSNIVNLYLRTFLELQEAPYHTVEELRQLRLKKLLNAAYKTTWWRRKLSNSGITYTDIRDIADIGKIPITKKEEVVDVKSEELCNGVSIYDPGIALRSTSGTSGVPIRWGLDKATHFIECAAYHLRILVNFGFPVMGNLGKQFLFMVNHYTVALHHLGLLARDIRVNLEIEPGQDSEQQQQRKAIYRAMNEARPFAVFGSTTNLWYLAQKMLQDKTRIEPALIIATGDMITKEMLEFFEQSFGCPVASFYGSQEVPAIGGFCPKERNVFHLNAEHMIMEIVGKDGGSLPAGRWGRIVTTCLSNLVMPLLRYCTDDIGRVLEGSCTCGSTLPRFELLGREHEFINLKSGELIPARFLHSIVLNGRFTKIHQYQIRQVTLDRVHIIIHPHLGWSEQDAFDLKAAVLRNFQGMLSTDISLVTGIPKIGRKHKSFVPLTGTKENPIIKTRDNIKWKI